MVISEVIGVLKAAFDEFGDIEVVYDPMNQIREGMWIDGFEMGSVPDREGNKVSVAILRKTPVDDPQPEPLT